MGLRSARQYYSDVISWRLVLAITEDEQLLTMLRSMDIRTWLRFFESRNHADRETCQLNQVCHWSVQCLLECHGALTLHCGRFGKRAQLTWYIIIFFEIFVILGQHLHMMRVAM